MLLAGSSGAQVIPAKFPTSWTDEGSSARTPFARQAKRALARRIITSRLIANTHPFDAYPKCSNPGNNAVKFLYISIISHVSFDVKQ
jgi:hypothetical protein